MSTMDKRYILATQIGIAWVIIHTDDAVVSFAFTL